MIMKKLLAYPYLTLLVISFLVVGGMWKLGYIELKTEEPAALSPEEAWSDPNNLTNTSTTDEIQLPASELSVVETTEKNTETTEELTDMQKPGLPIFFEADRSYFDDALFIGDSRTMGLYEYGDLGNAIVLADSGMSVYKVFKQSFSLDTGEKMTLDEILSQKHFGKVYIMLGINELGYSFEQTVDVYRDMVEQVETKQPDALIFLQANLHITEKKSATSPIYNNANINRFNQEVQNMTDSMHRFYLDANELFDDENGNLSVEYTVDESHVLGKYYAGWVDWILHHAVTFHDKL